MVVRLFPRRKVPGGTVPGREKRMSILTTKISDTVYEFTESADFDGSGAMRPYVDAYLVIGKDKALVIDALQKEEGLYGEVRKITELPLEVLITHGHLDHAGASLPAFHEAGIPIHLDLSDYDLLAGSVPTTRREFFTPLVPGESFDIGGFSFEAVPCPGHTPGCYVFLDRENGLLFSGDSIGSGMIWLQLPCCTPISVYRDSVQALWEKTKDLENLLIYPGHRNQSPEQLVGRYVKDNLEIAEGILDGSLAGEEQVMDFHGKELRFRLLSRGQMRMFCYNPENVTI